MKRSAYPLFLAVVGFLFLAIVGGSHGKGPPPPPGGGGAPSAPTGLAAALAFPHHVRLSWNANPEPNILGYNVYRNTSSKGTFTRINPSPVTATSFLDTTVAAGTTYYYKVSAVNISGTEGKPSALASIRVVEVTDTFPPANPSGFGAQGGYGLSSLIWKNPPDTDFAGTTVRYGLSGYPSGPQGGFPVCDRPASPGTSDSFLHGGLVNGQTYYYAAFSYDTSGNYSAGVTASATPTDNVPPVITGLREENVTSAGATIRWGTDEPADSQVEYGESAGYGSMTPVTAAMVTDHTMELSGLSPATLYHYRVISRDATGNRSSSGDKTFTTVPLAGIACRDCHGPLTQYENFESGGHGKSGIAFSCETCHTSGHGHDNTYKELKTIGGFSYPGLSSDLTATTDARRNYCLFACHAPLPGGEHPTGYDFVARSNLWKFIEILSPEENMRKYGYDPGTVLPVSPEVKLMDVDRNGINSYGDIVMCTTCHELHGTPTGYHMTPIITGPDNVNLLCVQCHPY